MWRKLARFIRREHLRLVFMGVLVCLLMWLLSPDLSHHERQQKIKRLKWMLKNRRQLTKTSEKTTTTPVVTYRPIPKPHRIPRILHQMWSTTEVPEAFVSWMRSWSKFNPDWTYFFWTDDALLKLVKRYYLRNLDAYRRYRENVSRSDAARVMLLHHYGGVYADLDMVALQSLDNYLDSHSCFVPANQPIHSPNNPKPEAINALMGCTKNHPFLSTVLQEMLRMPTSKDILKVAGPHCLDKALNIYRKLEQSNGERVDSHAAAHGSNVNRSIKQKNTSRYNDQTALKSFTFSKLSVTLESPEVFMPTIDWHWNITQCYSSVHTLPDNVKHACDLYRRHGAKAFTVTSRSLTDHMWFHSYIFKENVRAMQTVNVEDIRPNVQINPLQTLD